MYKKIIKLTRYTFSSSQRRHPYFLWNNPGPVTLPDLRKRFLAPALSTGDMSHLPLSTVAEELRKQIKEMIPETATADQQALSEKATVRTEDQKGNKTYTGDSLGKLVSRLVEELRIGKVCIHPWSV